MIDTATAATIVNQAKTNGNTITVTLKDGTKATGDAISVNTKGVNLRIDGKTRSFGLGRIDLIEQDTPDVADEMTTREVAAIFDMSAKELRVITRRMGLGVGKGKRYTFVPADVDAIRAHLADA